jgi:hypothetical protein
MFNTHKGNYSSVRLVFCHWDITYKYAVEVGKHDSGSFSLVPLRRYFLVKVFPPSYNNTKVVQEKA